jgi:hypothetical protein
MVKVEEDPFTGTERFVVKMTMIEASTRYLREFVDSTFLQLPFDTEIASDMQGETEQRVKAMAGVKKKPNAFHILDSMRADGDGLQGRRRAWPGRRARAGPRPGARGGRERAGGWR